MPDINLPIINSLLHPAIGQMNASPIIGAFTGDGTLALPTLPPAYGLHWHFFTVPAEWGRRLGNPDQLVPAPLQLGVRYSDIGANTYDQQVRWQDTDGGIYFWDVALPGEVAYHIAPGVVVTFDWMVVG